MVHCKASVFRLPWGSVLLVMSRLTVLTPISALQFECGWATDNRRWWTPQSLRNWHVVEINSGPTSVAHSSGMPKVPNMPRKQSIRPFDPACACSMMGQLEYLSNHNKVVLTLVVEKVSRYALEWICW